MDKILVVEEAPPQILLLGNSRMDKDMIPALLSARLSASAFNLGMPGAEDCNIVDIVRRLADNDVFQEGKVRQVLIGLDESLLERRTGLGFLVGLRRTDPFPDAVRWRTQEVIHFNF